MTQILVLAGGLGTRLHPITESLPKSMVPICGRPFIDYQLNWLARCGISKVVLSIGYLGNQIKNYVKDGSNWGLNVQYVEEGSDLRGTGGAVRLAFDLGVLEASFFLTYGDSFLPISYQEVGSEFNRHSEPAMMTVLRNLNRWDQSNVCFKGGKISLYQKEKRQEFESQKAKPEMEFIDYGLSIMRREVVESRIPSGVKFDLATLFHQLSVEGLLGGFEVMERFYEVGSFQGIQDLEKFLLRSENQVCLT